MEISASCALHLSTDSNSPIEQSATVLYAYDYALTFALEIKVIWARRFSFATAVFLAGRYLILVNRCLRIVLLYEWRGYTESQANYVSGNHPFHQFTHYERRMNHRCEKFFNDL